MATAVIMPLLGEAVIEGTVVRWLKQPGDKVALYEPILEIETDKVTTEATAEAEGILLNILVPEGETVEVGTVLGFIGYAGEEVGDEMVPDRIDAAFSQDDEMKEAVTARPLAQVSRGQIPSPIGDGKPVAAAAPKYKKPYLGRISPVVGRIAEEHGVDLNAVPGTGRDGRITKKDILAYIEARDGEPSPTLSQITPAAVIPSEAAVRPVEPVPGELLKLTTIRRSIAEHMVRSKHTSPHVTTVFEVDFSRVDHHRRANKEQFARDGASLTFTAYIVAAIVRALKSHPLVNSSWTDHGILVGQEINVGVAAAINDGLIVPVIKNADSMSLLGLARAVNDLANRARLNSLKPDEVQGATFTLTNHGTSGSLFATPIINQPNCGILGVGKIEKRVKVINDAIAIRLLAYTSLTFDHRILDGAAADAFLHTFQEVIESWD